LENFHLYILITVKVSTMTKVTSQALYKKNIEIKEKKKKINESSGTYIYIYIYIYIGRYLFACYTGR